MGSKQPLRWTDEDFYELLEEKDRLPLQKPELCTKSELSQAESEGFTRGVWVGILITALAVTLQLIVSFL